MPKALNWAKTLYSSTLIESLLRRYLERRPRRNVARLVKRRRHRSRFRQAAKQARIGPRKLPRALNGLLVPLLLVAVVAASAIRVLAVAKIKNNRRNLRARMPFVLRTESVRMAAMANDAIRSEALKKCQQRLDLACVLLVFAKRLSLESVSVPKERKTIAEGATANSIVHSPYGKRA